MYSRRFRVYIVSLSTLHPLFHPQCHTGNQELEWTWDQVLGRICSRGQKHWHWRTEEQKSIIDWVHISSQSDMPHSIHTGFSTQLAKCLLHLGIFGVYCHYCGWSGNESTLMLLQPIVCEHYYNTVCGCLYVNTSTVQTTEIHSRFITAAEVTPYHWNLNTNHHRHLFRCL